MNLSPLLSEEKSAKSIIVSVLSNKFPLTAKQVHQRILKTVPTVNLTYQAVHKALVQLSGQKIVEKDAKGGYRLDISWIRGLKEFGDRVESAYVGQNIVSFTDIAEGSTVSITFPSFLHSLYWFLHQMAADYAANPEPDITIGVWYHVWPFTMTTDEDYKKLVLIMSKGKHYAISPSNTSLDKFLMGFMLKMGKIARLGVDCDLSADILITRDLYIQFFLAPELKKKMDAVYAESKPGPGMDVTALYKLFSDQSLPVTVVVVRNKDLVQQRIKAILAEYFDGK